MMRTRASEIIERFVEGHLTAAAAAAAASGSRPRISAARPMKVYKDLRSLLPRYDDLVSEQP